MLYTNVKCALPNTKTDLSIKILGIFVINTSTLKSDYCTFMPLYYVFIFF